MAQITKDFENFPDTYIAPIVAKILFEYSSIDLKGWSVAPIAVISVGEGTVGLLRCSGEARTADGVKEWSVIIKVVEPDGTNKFGGQSETSSVWSEIETYRRDLFARRNGPFRGARCYQVDERPDGLVWLWLEDLAKLSGSMWSIDEYCSVSNAIGQFRGAWLESPGQDTSWLKINGEIDELLNSGLLAQNQDNLLTLRNSEYLREGLPGPLYDRALSLKETVPLIADVARSLPSTLAHNDCHIRNLFVSQSDSALPEVVAIDFARVGVGHIGSDGGTLFGSAFMWTDAEAEVVMADPDRIYDAWIEGISSQGWSGEKEIARFGYLVPLLRRTMMVSGMLAWVALDSEFPLQRYGGARDEMPGSIRRRIEFMAPLCEEARVLANQISR